MKVTGLFLGSARPLGPQNISSGIAKKPVSQAQVNQLGIVGDVQVDKRYHGGPERALHQFSLRGYEILIKRHPLMHKRATPGSIGENISSPLMDDSNVNIGDIYRIGDVQVQVSSPRIPCWKIEEKLKQSGLVSLIKQQQITGWYYRVLQGGVLNVGDEITLTQRLNEKLSVASFIKQYYDRDLAVQGIEHLSEAQGLDPQWRDKLRARIE